MNDGWVLFTRHLLNAYNIVLVEVVGIISTQLMLLLLIVHLCLAFPLNIVSNFHMVKLVRLDRRVQMLLREH